MASEAVTATVKNILGKPVQGVNVHAYDDATDTLADSGITDSNGVANLTLSGDIAGIGYRLTATKDGVAGGNSAKVLVTS